MNLRQPPAAGTIVFMLTSAYHASMPARQLLPGLSSRFHVAMTLENAEAGLCSALTQHSSAILRQVMADRGQPCKRSLSALLSAPVT